MGYVRARVSDEAMEGWLAFCREHGISVSSMVEALGQLLTDWVEEGTLSERGAEVVRRAREVDNDRRRRR